LPAGSVLAGSEVVGQSAHFCHGHDSLKNDALFTWTFFNDQRPDTFAPKSNYKRCTVVDTFA
jgi:hypothetical protein